MRFLSTYLLAFTIVSAGIGGSVVFHSLGIVAWLAWTLASGIASFAAGRFMAIANAKH